MTELIWHARAGATSRCVRADGQTINFGHHADHRSWIYKLVLYQQHCRVYALACIATCVHILHAG